VRTNKLVGKSRVVDSCRALRTIKVMAPIQRGAVIVPNIRDSSVDVIASRTMAAI
jgi:CxxC motif-containing protein